MYASEQKNMRFSGIFFSKSIPNGSSGKTTPPCLWNDHNWLVNLPFSDTPKIILKLVSWTSCIILSIYLSIYLPIYIYIYIYHELGQNISHENIPLDIHFFFPHNPLDYEILMAGHRIHFVPPCGKRSTSRRVLEWDGPSTAWPWPVIQLMNLGSWQKKQLTLGKNVGVISILRGYPLVICYMAIENGPVIVDLPMKNGDFP